LPEEKTFFAGGYQPRGKVEKNDLFRQQVAMSDEHKAAVAHRLGLLCDGSGGDAHLPENGFGFSSKKAGKRGKINNRSRRMLIDVGKKRKGQGAKRKRRYTFSKATRPYSHLPAPATGEKKKKTRGGPGS